MNGIEIALDESFIRRVISLKPAKSERVVFGLLVDGRGWPLL